MGTKIVSLTVPISLVDEINKVSRAEGVSRSSLLCKVFRRYAWEDQTREAKLKAEEISTVELPSYLLEVAKMEGLRKGMSRDAMIRKALCAYLSTSRISVRVPLCGVEKKCLDQNRNANLYLEKLIKEALRNGSYPVLCRMAGEKACHPHECTEHVFSLPQTSYKQHIAQVEAQDAQPNPITTLRLLVRVDTSDSFRREVALRKIEMNKQQTEDLNDW